MAKSLINTAMSLFGGAGLGALAMYLLDPDQGADRRDDVATATGSAVSSTADAVHGTARSVGSSAKSAASSVADYAYDVVGTVSDHVGSTAATASDHASSILSKAREAASAAYESVVGSAMKLTAKTSKSASNAKDDLSDRVHSLWKSAGKTVKTTKKSVTKEESHPIATATGITAGTIGVLVVGAGLMYFLDPERGRSRRAMTSDKFLGFTGRTGKSLRSYGRHIGNRTNGYAAQAKHLYNDVQSKVMPSDQDSESP